MESSRKLPTSWISVIVLALSVACNGNSDYPRSGVQQMNMDDEVISKIQQRDFQLPTDQKGQIVQFEQLLGDVDEMTGPEDFVGGNLTCDLCLWFVEEVQKLSKFKDAEKLIVDFAIEVCKLKKISDDRVCEMIVHEFKDVGVFIIKKGTFVPKELCGRFLTNVCPPFDGPWWNVTFPNTTKPTPQPPTPPKAGAPKLRFLKLSDIHTDFQYREGAKVKCGEPICCRDNDNTNHWVSEEKAGRYGNPTYCDACVDMVTSMFQHLKTIKDQFDFIIFTGDVPAHDVWNQTETTQLEHVIWLEKMFSTYLPGKPVYYSAGNHEGVPVSNFPPPGYENFTMDWLYTPLVTIWGKFLDEPAKETIRKCGAFSYSPYKGFRIISLNTNYGAKGNFFLMINATDPCGSLQWLITELQSAEDKGEKVHLITHYANKPLLKPWSWNFYSIVNRYENTIVNMFNGHSHTDWYQVYYDQDTLTRPLGWAWVGPAASGHTDLFPTFRIYTMDGNYEGSSWAVLDFDNYYLNVTQANMDLKPQWKFMYNPKTAYNMTSLYATDWDDLVHRMKKDDSLFQKFYRHYRSWFPTKHCDEKCKTKLLKNLVSARKS